MIGWWDTNKEPRSFNWRNCTLSSAGIRFARSCARIFKGYVSGDAWSSVSVSVWISVSAVWRGVTRCDVMRCEVRWGVMWEVSVRMCEWAWWEGVVSVCTLLLLLLLLLFLWLIERCRTLSTRMGWSRSAACLSPLTHKPLFPTWPLQINIISI